VQSVPNPKAEPVKLWLAKIGHERIKEMADPEIALNHFLEVPYGQSSPLTAYSLPLY
jgi:hypothetical protein